ncbi:hypothetical protein J437_LFUL013729 [Ladona fulva]|uniref:Uncharacterized protein n=1 Tax=Ladona fulva TaxID=123851 RepID=A0A8K0P9T7_LADFU|nr:hypothetical protein J437_LFUL013729 [Ladona fulva]
MKPSRWMALQVAQGSSACRMGQDAAAVDTGCLHDIGFLRCQLWLAAALCKPNQSWFLTITLEKTFGS